MTPRDEMEAAAAAERRAAADLAALFHAVFVVDVRGRAVLESLERKFCTQSTVVTEGGVDAVLKTFTRAARREVIDHIHLQIGRHLGEPEPTPEANQGA